MSHNEIHMHRLIPMLVVLCSLPLLMAVPMTKLTVQVNAAESGKPIDRASVIVRFRRSKFKVKLKNMTTSWETKTNQQGAITLPEMPQGEITVQVIANHYQTFGDVFELDQPTQTIAIKLNPPQQQYSAHEKPTPK